MKYFSDRGKCTQKIQKGGGEKKNGCEQGFKWGDRILGIFKGRIKYFPTHVHRAWTGMLDDLNPGRNNRIGGCN